jgi:tetratricopeptide (TPR) repeat protein
MADLGGLFRQADETARGLAQQAIDAYHYMPPEVLAAAAGATAIVGYASVALGWWRGLRNIWLRIFHPNKFTAEQPATKGDFLKLQKQIEEFIEIMKRSRLPAAQTAERVQQIESASTSKLPEVQNALQQFLDNKADDAYATLMKVAAERRAANDIEAAAAELLRAAAFVSVSNPKKAAEAYEQALALKPDSHTAHLGLAYYDLATGNSDKALAHAEQAQRYARTDSEAAYARTALATILLRRGQGDRALALARDGVKQFRAMHEAKPEDELVNRSLGEALQRLGEVQATLGDLAGARQSCQQAYDLRADLAGKLPNNGDVQREHYLAAVNLASTLAGWGDLSNALTYAQHAETLSAAVAEVNPSRSDILREALICRNEHGRLLQQSGDLRGALQRYEKSMAEFRELAKRHPDLLQHAIDLKNAYLLLSESRERAGDLDTALMDARRGVEIAEQLRARSPNDTIILAEEINARRWLAGIEARAGNLEVAGRHCEAALAAAQDASVNFIARESTIAVLFQIRASLRTQTGDIHAASGDYAQAIALYEALHQSQPDAAAVTQQLLNCRIEHAELKAQVGEVGDADTILDGCVAAADSLAAQHPHVIDTRRIAAWVRYRLGQRMRSGGDANGAVAALRDARNRYQALAGADAADAGDRTMIAWANIVLAHALTATGNFAEAETAAAAALDTATQLTLADPLNANTQSLLASAVETEGYMNGARGRLHDHVRAFERMLKINTDLAKREGSGADAQRNLATSYLVLGQALAVVGRVPEALQNLATALKLRERTVERFARWEDKVGLVRALLAIASANDEPKKADEGLTHVAAALPIADELARTLPDVAAAQAILAATYHQKGDLLLALGRYAEAEAAYETDVAAYRTLLRRDKANADLRERIAGSEACIAECRFLEGDRQSAKPLFVGALASYRAIAEAQTNDHWLSWNILWPTFRLAQIAGDKPGQLEAARMLKSLQERDGRDRIGRHFGWLTDMRNLFPELG